MAIRKTRNVSLTLELDALVDGRVAVGRFRSASEVVRTALCLVEDTGATSTQGQRHQEREAAIAIPGL